MPAGLKHDLSLQAAQSEAILSATRTLQLETEGLNALKAALASELIGSFAEAVQSLRACRGRVIVTGMGKSGHVGLKVAATLSSTGTPAYFVHPSEASHGDLGMITRDDAILAFSWSGETVELGNIVSYSRRFARAPDRRDLEPAIHARASRRDRSRPAAGEGSVPARARTHHLDHHAACARRLPRARTTRKQGLHGDRLQGAASRRPARRAAEIRGRPDAQGRPPAARAGHAAMAEAIVVMTEKALGCLGVVDGGGMLVGIITDGDLRRHMGDGLLARCAADIMTPGPRPFPPIFWRAPLSS